jgi:glycosyltransferase involved in cell wall biosynthesis
MKDKLQTFIIISPGFARDEKDSTCLPVQQTLVKRLNKNHPELQIIILALEYPFHRSTYQWKGNTVISFNGWGKGKLKKMFNWISVWRTLNKLKQQHNIIGILSFWCTQCALIGKYFSMYNHINYYCWILGQDAKKENKYIKWIRPKSNELIALSDFVTMEFYRNHHILPMHVIPPGIEQTSFSKQNFIRGIDILAVGSLISLKRYETFITIIYELKEYFPDIKATLCGKGPEEQKLKNLITELKLENNISITGEKQHAEVLEMMQHTKIFMHPSSYEGFGIVCIEALYAGAHVISFCKPMNNPISHWHIVKSEKEMLRKAIDLLHNNEIEYTTVMPFAMNDCAKRIMHLFNYHTDNNLKRIATENVNGYN